MRHEDTLAGEVEERVDLRPEVAIVALARRGGTVSTVVFALCAILVCTSALLWVARSVLAAIELPPEFARRLVIADLCYTAVPIAAVTITALLLGRRQPRPTIISHFTFVVVIGLVAWSIAVALSGWIGPDMVNAIA